MSVTMPTAEQIAAIVEPLLGQVFKDGGILGLPQLHRLRCQFRCGRHPLAGRRVPAGKSIDHPKAYVSQILAIMTGTELGDVATPEVDTAV